MTLPHGGNIYYYSRKYGIPERDILDFSASINPLGPPESALKALAQAVPSLVNYPDPDCTALREALSARMGVDGGSIVFGNGSTELIYLLPRALAPKKVLVTAPGFSDYERAARLAGCEVLYLTLREENRFEPDMDALRGALEGIGLFFLCNPNNPTGALLKKDAVREITGIASGMGVTTCVDEAFMDFVPGESVVGEAAEQDGVAVLRNFTKFYAMPGLRLGYLVAGPGLAEKLRRAQEPWSVNTLAQAAAAAALSDAGFARASLRLMDAEREYLCRALSGLPGLEPFPASANFILVKLKGIASAELAEALARRGILVRDCGNFRGLDGEFVRVAVRTRSEDERLVEALESFTIK